MARKFTGTSFLSINEAWSLEFRRRIRAENLKVIYVTSIVGLGFLVLLMYLDYLRFSAGKLPGEPLYEFLFFNHLMFGLFAIPVWIITKNRATIRTGTYRHGATLTYWWISICGVIILMMAALGLWERGSLILYVVFIFLLNFVIVLPHEERIIFNLVSFVIILLAIIVNFYGDREMLIIKTIESLGVTVPAFIVSTYRYNTFVKQISSEKLLASKNEAIEDARKRSDELLLNILPKSIAEELKENGKVAPRQFKSITIMFVDIVGFTIISKVLPPKKLVSDLDYCFTNFDQIMARYKVEKIKTMGDAYICVAGLNGQPDHSIRMIKAAREIVAFSESWKKEKEERSEPPYDVRIGIHSGPIVAGVVGLQKFAFDIWGDAVNIAARMEASSEQGKINVSESTFQLIKNEFECTPRGKIAIKNGGEVEMYFVDN